MPSVTFNPYAAAKALGSIDGTSGINWSYERFPDASKAESFEKQCEIAGYRTRNKHVNKDGTVSVQYHHYID